MAGRIGWTRCGCCGQPEAAVTETDKGTLSITCHKCQFSAYAKAGTKAKRLIQAGMTLDDEDAPKGKPETSPKVEHQPTPEPAAARGFGTLLG